MLKSKSTLTRILRSVCAIALMTAALAQAAELRIGGTGNALGTMRLLSEAFAKAQPAAKSIVLSSIGSSGAIKAVPKGAIDIGLSSRPLTEEETRTGMTTIEYARAPTVFAVQEKNPVTALTVEQIADIYTGKLASWPDGTPIRLVMRQPGDDNTRQIKQLSAAIEQALAVAEKRPGLNFASNDQEAADKMESIQGSLGVTALSLIRSEQRSLRALALNGITPTTDNLQAGRYPAAMVKRFYFVLPKEPGPATQEFLKFVRSAEARKLLEQTGHIIP